MCKLLIAFNVKKTEIVQFISAKCSSVFLIYFATKKLSHVWSKNDKRNPFLFELIV